MCLLIFALNYHPDYKLVLLANRDEFYARPTAKAHQWDCAGKIIAGRDLQAGGTWLGIDRKGRFSALTNYRDPKNIKANAPSRGELVQNYLLSQTDPLKYMFQVQYKAHNFNGFNLLVGNREDIFYYSNYAKSIQKIGDGIHGLSNHLLNTYWYKVGLGKEKLENYLNQNERLNIDDLLGILEDESLPAEDHFIQQTGLPFEMEKMLAPIFIRSENYGTCSSTVLLWDINDKVTFVEKSYQYGKPDSIQKFSFLVEV
ncbi:MAG: NRDE family protein [Raineya sp.]|nr:NRDE family protein [Raineya sp.]MDW8295596.1 NRDE family protein [Raineya sp.]